MKRFLTIAAALIMLAAAGAWAADITDLSGITGKVGQEDINYGSGQSTDTFSVPTYDGGTDTYTKVPSPNAGAHSIIKNRWYVSTSVTVTDHGDDSVAGSLAWIIGQVSTDNQAVELPGNTTYTVSTDLTVPANVTLVFQRGAALSVDSGKTVTINGYVEAGPHEIFTGSGTVSQTTYPRNDAWWGNTAGILLSDGAGGTVKIPTSGLATGSGDIFYFDGTSIVPLAAGSAGEYLEGGTPPAWSTPGAMVGLQFGLRPSLKDDDEIYVTAGTIVIGSTSYSCSSRLTKTYDTAADSASEHYYIYVKPPASGTTLTATEIELATTAPEYDVDQSAPFHPTNTTWRFIGDASTDASKDFEVVIPYDADPVLGDVKYTTARSAISGFVPSGWLEYNGESIGDSSSGADHAGDEYRALFLLLWNSMANTEAAVSTGRGSSADADWTAHKTLTLPNAIGRAMIGTGTGDAADATAHANGGTGGAETHTLTGAQIPLHRHGLPLSGSGGVLKYKVATTDDAEDDADYGTGTVDNPDTGHTVTDWAGSGQAHNIMQPYIASMVLVRMWGY